ncbi:DUF1203 domain-containing protein [Streptomyces sp. NPDC002248]|uniref:DUF1203 domain-containing protein n=1 Tax=unclassified Streptomyces TaxID=2593676 RepID=UPI001013B84F|nr:DUF1203 domain-containing protein [Streptomyces sp. GZWMJZ-114]
MDLSAPLAPAPAAPVALRFHPLPATVLDRVRGTGRDALDRPAERLCAEGGEPLRCCLRDAVPGEGLLLFGFAPPLPESPYREVGAVFAHAAPCPRPADPAAYPGDWRGRPQVLRAYDGRGRIHEATRVHDGRDPEAALAALLALPGVARVHSRNVAWGCWMFAVTRG